MKKRNAIFLFSGIVIVIITVVLIFFLPKPITLLNKDWRSLQASEISAIEMERSPCCGPEEGATVNKTLVDTENIINIVNAIKHTKVAHDYEQYNGGTNISILFMMKDGSKIEIGLKQGKVSGTSYKVLSKEFWNTIDKIFAEERINS